MSKRATFTILIFCVLFISLYFLYIIEGKKVTYSSKEIPAKVISEPESYLVEYKDGKTKVLIFSGTKGANFSEIDNVKKKGNILYIYISEQKLKNMTYNEVTVKGKYEKVRVKTKGFNGKEYNLVPNRW